MPDRGVILSLTERLPKFSMSCDALPIFSFAERLPKFSMAEDNTASNDVFVRFAQSSLVWLDEDNKVGVVKYNTLVASGSWSLEEVEIEELL